jgi:hypothetical protein
MPTEFAKERRANRTGERGRVDIIGREANKLREFPLMRNKIKERQVTPHKKTQIVHVGRLKTPQTYLKTVSISSHFHLQHINNMSRRDTYEAETAGKKRYCNAVRKK